MTDREEATRKIETEVTRDDPEVRERFVSEFGKEIGDFVAVMANAQLRWFALDQRIWPDERLGHVSAFVYSALALHILSMKLLLSGHIVASGNLLRQVIESIAMALLCSGRELGVL